MTAEQGRTKKAMKKTAVEKALGKRHCGKCATENALQKTLAPILQKNVYKSILRAAE